ncbi:conserved hypothetical protein [Ricinus communis]|uniref:Uncharacterized protein n=1 Tax=Ricinus communis TaxID=3988 RepID=B9SNM2_RICCO|nr:conserved hypothetical protein [Ricinus communis]
MGEPAERAASETRQQAKAAQLEHLTQSLNLQRAEGDSSEGSHNRSHWEIRNH